MSGGGDQDRARDFRELARPPRQCEAGPLEWERDGSDVVPGTAAPLRLTFTPTDLPRDGLRQVHHLTSNATSQEARVARALERGAPHLDVGQLPDGNQFRTQVGS